MPSSKRSRAKLLTSTLFAVETPTTMMMPISAGTLSGVPVTHRPKSAPETASGKTADRHEGQGPRLEIHHHHQEHQHGGETQTADEFGVSGLHQRGLAGEVDFGCPASVFAVAQIDGE